MEGPQTSSSHFSSSLWKFIVLGSGQPCPDAPNCLDCLGCLGSPRGPGFLCAFALLISHSAMGCDRLSLAQALLLGAPLTSWQCLTFLSERLLTGKYFKNLPRVGRGLCN